MTRVYVLFGVSAAAAAVVLAASAFTEAPSLAQLAQRLYAQCHAASSPTRCYETALPEAAEALSMEDGFLLIERVQALDPSFVYCHIAAHRLAEREVAKDPDAWQDVLLRVPVDACSAGGVHGAFRQGFVEGRSSARTLDGLIGEIVSACARTADKTQYVRNSCDHAAGHLLMYFLDGSVAESYDACDAFAVRADRTAAATLCYAGASMQFFYLLEERDYRLVEGKRPASYADAIALCQGFAGARRSACVTYATIGYGAGDGEQAKLARSLSGCAAAGDALQRKRCELNAMAVFASEHVRSPQDAEAYCRSYGEREGACLVGAALRTVELDASRFKDAAALCSRAAAVTGGEACAAELRDAVGRFLLPGDPRRTAACEAVPDAEGCAAYSRMHQ